MFQANIRSPVRHLSSEIYPVPGLLVYSKFVIDSFLDILEYYRNVFSPNKPTMHPGWINSLEQIQQKPTRKTVPAVDVQGAHNSSVLTIGFFKTRRLGGEQTRKRAMKLFLVTWMYIYIYVYIYIHHWLNAFPIWAANMLEFRSWVSTQ